MFSAKIVPRVIKAHFHSQNKDWFSRLLDGGRVLLARPAYTFYFEPDFFWYRESNIDISVTGVCYSTEVSFPKYTV